MKSKNILRINFFNPIRVGTSESKFFDTTGKSQIKTKDFKITLLDEGIIRIQDPNSDLPMYSTLFNTIWFELDEESQA